MEEKKFTPRLEDFDFSCLANEALQSNEELKATIKLIIEANLLGKEDLESLINYMGGDQDFYIYFNHRILIDLKKAHILNEENISTFFSLIDQSAFLSDISLLLTRGKIMHTSWQAQKNFDALCSIGKKILKMRSDSTRLSCNQERAKFNAAIESYSDGLQEVMAKVAHINNKTPEDFQAIYDAIMHFAADPFLLRKLLKSLAGAENSVQPLTKEHFWSVIYQLNKNIQHEQKLLSKIFKEKTTGLPLDEIKLSSMIYAFFATNSFSCEEPPAPEISDSNLKAPSSTSLQ